MKALWLLAVGVVIAIGSTAAMTQPVKTLQEQLVGTWSMTGHNDPSHRPRSRPYQIALRWRIGAPGVMACAAAMIALVSMP